MKSNIVAVICYLLGVIGGVLFLILTPYKNNPEVRFHAWQSIFLGVAYMGITIAVTLISGAFPSLSIVSLPISLAMLIAWVVLLVKSYQGTKIKLPLLGTFAETMAGN